MYLGNLRSSDALSERSMASEMIESKISPGFSLLADVAAYRKPSLSKSRYPADLIPRSSNGSLSKPPTPITNSFGSLSSYASWDSENEFPPLSPLNNMKERLAKIASLQREKSLQPESRQSFDMDEICLQIYRTYNFEDLQELDTFVWKALSKLTQQHNALQPKIWKLQQKIRLDRMESALRFVSSMSFQAIPEAADRLSQLAKLQIEDSRLKHEFLTHVISLVTQSHRQLTIRSQSYDKLLSDLSTQTEQSEQYQAEINRATTAVGALLEHYGSLREEKTINSANSAGHLDHLLPDLSHLLQELEQRVQTANASFEQLQEKYNTEQQASKSNQSYPIPESHNANHPMQEPIPLRRDERARLSEADLYYKEALTRRMENEHLKSELAEARCTISELEARFSSSNGNGNMLDTKYESFFQISQQQALEKQRLEADMKERVQSVNELDEELMNTRESLVIKDTSTGNISSKYLRSHFRMAMKAKEQEWQSKIKQLEDELNQVKLGVRLNDAVEALHQR